MIVARYKRTLYSNSKNSTIVLERGIWGTMLRGTGRPCGGLNEVAVATLFRVETKKTSLRGGP